MECSRKFCFRYLVFDIISLLFEQPLCMYMCMNVSQLACSHDDGNFQIQLNARGLT